MCKEVDSFQRQELFNEKEKWREIVKSLLEATLHLAERNLPYKSSSSAVGDPENDLFLGTLELIGNHDAYDSRSIKDHLDTVRKHQRYNIRAIRAFINIRAIRALSDIIRSAAPRVLYLIKHSCSYIKYYVI